VVDTAEDLDAHPRGLMALFVFVRSILIPPTAPIPLTRWREPAPSAQNYTDNMWQNYRPDVFYNNLNFTDLGLNSMWASWLYDNPGFDTDEDGYRGKFRVCMDSIQGPDTIYYEGDNVPDFRGHATSGAEGVVVVGRRRIAE
jgi:hypothetical protein